MFMNEFLDEFELGVLEVVPIALLIFNSSGKVRRTNSQWKLLAQQIGLK